MLKSYLIKILAEQIARIEAVSTETAKSMLSALSEAQLDSIADRYLG